ncbi:hypothetical protein BKA65DRAFT_550150 [Rhexocercosporidium sp. MPI-PUGE-AT-0058]|nr:hypothetical protein BKA65DRAFT_550150 [Rhexocercosporidium sp. MPI-PUGE-AT-0058]
MDQSELERNLLPDKDVYDNSDEDSETSGPSWNPKKSSYVNRIRNGVKDSFGSQGQRILLLVSALLNTVLLIAILGGARAHNDINCRSPTIGLLPNTMERTISDITPFSFRSDNNSARDALWNSLATDRGVVAVDQETIAKQGLTDTITFPWDPTKRVYIVIAFHQLHCLKLIYKTLTSVYNGETLVKPVYEHCVHCLDQLRQDTECSADDNLWYVGQKSTGQNRKCKDFSKLDNWALERHACYNFERPMKPGPLDVEAFTNCRDSSPYLQVMKDHFGYGKDWHGDYPAHEGPTFDS